MNVNFFKKLNHEGLSYMFNSVFSMKQVDFLIIYVQYCI